MHRGPINEWLDDGGISNVADGTQPAASFGTSVTPAQNSLAQSYTTLIASLAHDCYWIDININTVRQAGVSRECVVSIGQGGVDKISFLLATQAHVYYDSSEFQGGGGINYSFPVFFPAGASVDAKASVSTSDVTAIRVHVRLRGKPSRPERVWAGSFVQAFGDVSASTFGTSITPGTASEGSWTSIGSTLDKPLRYVDWGFGRNSNANGAQLTHVDVGIGDGSNKRVIRANERWLTSTDEGARKDKVGAAWFTGAVGDQLYMRAQSTSGPPSNCKGAIYGVG